MQQAKERINGVIDGGADQITGFLQSLIGLQQQGEAAVQQAVASRLEGLGATVHTLTYSPKSVPMVNEFAATPNAASDDRASVVGVLESTAGSGRSVILFAHPDAEPLQDQHGWDRDPFAGDIADGRIYGWGVADDLAGVAIAVMALEMIASAGITLAGDVVVASTPSKRHARGVAAVMHQGYVADGAIYLHPAESGVGMHEVKAFASGQLEFRIAVEGRLPPTTEPGHTSFAHLGVNPLDKALLLIDALKALDGTRAARVHHPLLDDAVGRSTNILISSLQFGTGKALSRLPVEASFSGAVSFPPGESMQMVQAEIEAAIGMAAGADSWLADHPPTITWLSGVTGAAVPADHELYAAVAGSIADVCGYTPHVNPMHTSSDIRNPMVQKGIPTVGLGPFCGDLTQTGRRNEWVDHDDYLRAVKVTALSLIAWCGVA